MTRDLIEAGASIDHQAKDGRTALIEGASAGSVPVARLLLENGASKSVVDRTGKTALDHAMAQADHPSPKQADYQELVVLLRD